MKRKGQASLNIGDQVKIKTDVEIIKRLIKEGFDSIPLESLSGDKVEITDEGEGEDENEVTYELNNNGNWFPEWALELVKKSSKTSSTEKIVIESQEDNFYLIFEKGKKYAQFPCGDKIELKELIELGEVAKEYISSVKQPAAKKVAKKEIIK